MTVFLSFPEIGSLQEALLEAMGNWFGPLNADPMFVAIVDVLANSISDVMKIASVDTVQSTIQVS